MIGRAVRVCLAAVIAVTTILPATIVPAQAASERELYLYYTHTRETARIVFKRNGRYVREGLNQLNYFLRDWRRDEPTEMDPALFDLVWEVYQEAGSNKPINIVSAYRAPATNNMLRSKSSGVAENSQHTHGRAMDFFIPGVPISKLREIAFRKQVGGVGYYPTSGSPFVHLDTASVRAWPRMTRNQLAQIFPDGRTLHLPASGGPLSQEGRQYAQAEWQRCHRVPCSAGAALDGSTRVAEGGRGRTLMDVFFGSDDEEDAATEVAEAQSAPAGPATRSVTSVAVAQTPPAAPTEAPTPLARPAAFAPEGTQVAQNSEPDTIPFAVIEADQRPERVAVLEAPVPPSRPAASTATETASEATLAIAALDAPPPSRPDSLEAGQVLSAYAPKAGPVGTSDATIQTASTSALDPAPARIATRPQAPQPTAAPEDEVQMQAAAFTPQMGLESFSHLFEGPILPKDRKPDAATQNALAALATRQGELFAPDTAHVTEVFVTGESLSGERFAVFTAPDEADFDPATELGPDSMQLAASPATAQFSEAPLAGTNDTIWVRFD